MIYSNVNKSIMNKYLGKEIYLTKFQIYHVIYHEILIVKIKFISSHRLFI